MTLTSAGAAATATVAGSPYPITPSNAIGTGLANYTISYVERHPDGRPGHADDHGGRRTKAYGQTLDFAGTEFTASGLLNADTVDSVTLTSAGAAATATVAGSPYPIVRVERRRHRPRQLRDRVYPGRPDDHAGRPDDHRQ